MAQNDSRDVDADEADTVAKARRCDRKRPLPAGFNPVIAHASQMRGQTL